MRITQWGEYGVHIAAYIARREREASASSADGSGLVGAAEIAKAQGLDLQYAQQILHRLRRGGLVDSARGPAGGYRLMRPASEISLLDLLIATEGDSFEVICDSKPVNLERCAPGTACGLRSIWHDLKEHVNAFLRRYSLEEISRLPSFNFSDLPADSDAPIKIGSHTGS